MTFTEVQHREQTGLVTSPEGGIANTSVDMWHSIKDLPNMRSGKGVAEPGEIDLGVGNLYPTDSNKGQKVAYHDDSGFGGTPRKHSILEDPPVDGHFGGRRDDGAADRVSPPIFDDSPNLNPRMLPTEPDRWAPDEVSPPARRGMGLPPDLDRDLPPEDALPKRLPQDNYELECRARVVQGDLEMDCRARKTSE